jgi:hypothetical protein
MFLLRAVAVGGAQGAKVEAGVRVASDVPSVRPSVLGTEVPVGRDPSRPLVLIGPYAHHSNILPWCEWGVGRE